MNKLYNRDDIVTRYDMFSYIYIICDILSCHELQVCWSLAFWSKCGNHFSHNYLLKSKNDNFQIFYPSFSKRLDCKRVYVAIFDISNKNKVGHMRTIKTKIYLNLFTFFGIYNEFMQLLKLTM
jgi:hypothetical protein